MRMANADLRCITAILTAIILSILENNAGVDERHHRGHRGFRHALCSWEDKVFGGTRSAVLEIVRSERK